MYVWNRRNHNPLNSTFQRNIVELLTRLHIEEDKHIFFISNQVIRNLVLYNITFNCELCILRTI